eukprot:TRINITY_DN8705_c0_g1_i2.p1 TRINITY_DN8705_c0_g1~~TRINITY_DN8705_c0_g1_i2.p1  ORF type:complete len:776 (+),score=124.48 TRINITY_DN8705_c0_g1_i2:1585-3912(+)
MATTTKLPSLADNTRVDCWLAEPSTSFHGAKPRRSRSFSELDSNDSSASRSMRRSRSNAQLPRLNTSSTQSSGISVKSELPDWQMTATMRSLNERKPDDYLGCSCPSCKDIQRQNKLTRNRYELIEALPPLKFKVGDRVVLTEERTGIVRWIGRFESKVLNTPLHVGLHLDDPKGNTDGIHAGKRYFRTNEKHGLFAPVEDVVLVKDRYQLNYRVVNPQALDKVAKKSISRPASMLLSSSKQPAQRKLASRNPRTSNSRRKSRFAHAKLADDPREPRRAVVREPPSRPSIDPNRLATVQKLLEAYRRGEKWLQEQENDGQSRLERLSKPKHPVQPLRTTKRVSIAVPKPEPPALESEGTATADDEDASNFHSQATDATDSDGDSGHTASTAPASDAERKNSAIKIQAAFRGYRSRKRTQAMKAEKLVSDVEAAVIGGSDSNADKELEQKVIKIQAAFRGYRARSSVASLRERRKKELLQQQQAAVKIQSAFRGHKARRRVTSMKEEQAAALQQEQVAEEDSSLQEVNFEEVLLDICMRVDTDEQGSFNLEEVQSLLASQMLNLALDDEQLTYILQSLPTNQEGRVEYESMLVPYLRQLVMDVVAEGMSDEESWVEIYSQMHEDVFYLQRTTGVAIAPLPQTAATYFPSVFQPAQSDFERMALTGFLAADRFGRGYLSAEEFVGLMRAPELNFQLDENEEQYYYDISQLAEVGYIEYPMFTAVMKQICARVYLAEAPEDAEWVAVTSQDFGEVYYHRVSGDSTLEPPEDFVVLEQL